METTGEAECRVVNGAQSACSKVVKAGLSIEVGHEFASSVFHQYRKLSGKEVGSTVIRNKPAALRNDLSAFRTGNTFPNGPSKVSTSYVESHPHTT